MKETLQDARNALDRIINKSRVHLYKPIQIAEILHRHRIVGDIIPEELDTYRTSSKRWRDIVCLRLVGRTSSSSARFQDNLFESNALPPHLIALLAQENKSRGGIVEAYIYQRFAERFSQLQTGISYLYTHNEQDFVLSDFLAQFWSEAGLKRSIDKVYEIVVYALFSALVESLGVHVHITSNPTQSQLLSEFADFAQRVIGIHPSQPDINIPARVYRVGVTNAADRGLDMWANFGMCVQIKHLSLTEDLAENIVESLNADRIVIVCKDSEQDTILSLLGQIGWKSRIQSIITQRDLERWYELALRHCCAPQMGGVILSKLLDEIHHEFPATHQTEFEYFLKERGYPCNVNW